MPVRLANHVAAEKVRGAVGGGQPDPRVAALHSSGKTLGRAIFSQLASHYVVLTTVIAAIVRLPTLGSKSFWYDEIISVAIAQEPIQTILSARLQMGASEAAFDRLYSTHPPLHFLIIHGMLHFSSNEAVIRLPFAMAGIATIPLAARVLTRLFGTPIAAAATLLLAVSPLTVAYSQEARPTALLVFFSMAALYALLQGVDHGRRRDWWCLAICGSLAIWTSYSALIAVIPMLVAVWLVLQGKELWCRHVSWSAFVRGPGLAFSVMALATLPLMRDLLTLAHWNQVEVTEPSAGWIAQAQSILVLATVLVAPIPKLGVFALIPMMLPLIGGYAVLRRLQRAEVAATAGVLCPLAILIAIQSSHFVQLRYFLPLLPLLIGILVSGMKYLVHPLQRCPLGQGVLLGVLVSGFTIGYGQGVLAYQRFNQHVELVKPNWRELVNTYREESHQNSCLIIVDPVGTAAYNVVPFYMQTSTQPGCYIDARSPLLVEVLAQHADVWVAVETGWYDRDDTFQLRRILAVDNNVDAYWFDGLVLVHLAADSGQTSHDALRKFLMQTYEVLEPDSASGRLLAAPAMREALANLEILGDKDLQQAASLVAGYDPPLGDQDFLQWDRARGRLDRADIAGARALAIRLVALYPGSADAYDLVADIEQHVNPGRADRYRAFANVLRDQAH